MRDFYILISDIYFYVEKNMERKKKIKIKVKN